MDFLSSGNLVCLLSIGQVCKVKVTNISMPVELVVTSRTHEKNIPPLRVTIYAY